MKFKLSEKSSSEYIFIDKDNKVHILVPINGGEEVGLDNTCQATSEIKHFFIGDQAKKIDDVVTVVQKYIDDLNYDIKFLMDHKLAPSEIEDKKHRLAQFQAYKKLLSEMITGPLLSSFSTSFPEFPDPIINAMKAADSNCVGVRLCPNSLDNYLRFHFPLFSLDRTDSPQSFKVLCGNRLRSSFESRILHLKDGKETVLEQIILAAKNITITSEEELNAFKGLIIEVLKRFDLHVERSTLDKDKRKINTTLSYFDNNCCLDATSTIKEWAQGIISTSVDEMVFANFKSTSPFQIKDTNAKTFFIKLQLFLAIINTYYLEKTGNRKNFGEILEKNSQLMQRLLDAINVGINQNFNIEDEILNFIDSNCEKSSSKVSSHFFPTLLTQGDRAHLKSKLYRVWHTINESPHFDEFVFMMPNMKGDFYIHKSRISLDLARYIKELNPAMFKKYYSSGLLSVKIDAQVPEVCHLPSHNNTDLQAEISVEQFVGLDTISIAKLLVSLTVDDKMVFDILSVEAIDLLKKRTDWHSIFSAIIKSDLPQAALNRFTAKIGASNCYVLDLNAVQALYTQISLLCKDDPMDNPLLFLSGMNKLRKALEFNEIDILDIEFNEGGDFLLTFPEGVDFQEITKKLIGIERDNKSKLHITSPMAPAYYQIAEALSTPALNVKQILASLNNFVPNARDSKMARAIQYTLNIPQHNIVSNNPRQGEINITYYFDNGYLVSGDPELIDRLRQSYYSRLTLALDPDQVEELLIAGGLKNTDENQKAIIENALNNLQIAFYGVRKVGSNWVIVVEEEKSKKLIEKICEPQVIQLRKDMKTREMIERKATEISNEFGMKPQAFLPNAKLPIVSVVYEFKSIEEKNLFAAIIKQISPKAILKDTPAAPGNPILEISAEFIHSVAMSQLRDAGKTHPAMKDRILDCAHTLSKTIGCKPSFFGNKDSKDSIDSIMLTLDPTIPLHREVAKYFLQFKNDCQYIPNKTGANLVIKSGVLLNLKTTKVLEEIMLHVKNHQKAQMKSEVESQLVDTSKIDYKVLLSKESVREIINYKEELARKIKIPGSYLAEQFLILKKGAADLTLEEFIDTIFQTKIPSIFAESQVIGNGLDWNADELKILGSISVAVPTQFYDDGKHISPKIHEQPFSGTLVYTPGALLRNKYGTEVPDRVAVVKNNKLDQQAFYQLYENRLLPVLLYINQTMAEKQSATANPKAFITVPGLGCSCFAAEFSGQLGEELRKVLVQLLKNHSDKLPHIKGVYYDPYNECVNQREKINHIDFLCRPNTKGNHNKAQLNPPSHYNETPDEFNDCELFSLVAWDHVSWVTNDLIRGSRATDDGVKGSASDTLTKITGYPGSYVPDPALPKFSPANYATWEQCIHDEGLSFAAKDRLYVSNGSVMEKLSGDKKLSKCYHFPLSYLDKIIAECGERISDLGLTPVDLHLPANFKRLLESQGCQVLDIKAHGQNGFEILCSEDTYCSITQSMGIPFHLKPDLAILLYREANRLGFKNSIENLRNDMHNGVKAEKLKTTLKLLNIKVADGDIDNHVDAELKSTYDGYDLMIQLEELSKIINLVKSFQSEFPTLKESINSKLDLFAKTTGFFTKKNERIEALKQAISNADDLLSIVSLLANQLELANNLPRGKVIPINLCASRWTTTTDQIPSNSKLFVQVLKEILDECMSPKVAPEIALN